MDTGDHSSEIHCSDDSIDEVSLLQVHRSVSTIQKQLAGQDGADITSSINAAEKSYPALSRFAWRPLFGRDTSAKDGYLMKRAKKYSYMRQAAAVVSSGLTAVSLIGGFWSLWGTVVAMFLDACGMLVTFAVNESRKAKANVQEGIRFPRRHHVEDFR